MTSRHRLARAFDTDESLPGGVPAAEATFVLTAGVDGAPAKSPAPARQPDTADGADQGRASETGPAPAARPLAVAAVAPETFALPADDRFADQFYLLDTAAGERDLHLFASPTGTGVWDEFTGTGVHVGIIDDGIDYNHPDLDDNYDATLETVDGFHPAATDAHGTAVAGIIASELNGVGTVGIAYDASITMMAAISDAPNITLAASLQNAVNFDVVNNSWGYTSFWYDQRFNPALSADYAAFDGIARDGRGGLGTVFVKSAGNGRTGDDAADNANFSALNSSDATVTVAAVNRDGFVTTYSTEGASLLVSAFGTPVAGQVVTTDRLGTAGYSAGDYTSSFNGTSAAAPMVTGIVALMLEANPTLGYRDVSEILALTARHTGSAIGAGPAGSEAYTWEWNHATHWNGQGMHFSEDYGFGLVDALAAVRLAESWTQQHTRADLAIQQQDSTSLAAPLAIPDNNATGITVTFSMAAGVRIEQMRLDLGLSHTWTGDLVMTLTSPSGTVSQLLDRNGGGTGVPNYGAYDITLASNMFRGEDSGGTWTLKIADLAAQDTGTLSNASLSAYGRSAVDDIYVMTEEASDYTIPSSITDGNGGTDTLNASAVFGASLIDLGGGASLIDRRSITLAGIENAVGGDGDDSIFGDAGANVLQGFRGNDLLEGSDGDDSLAGGAGDDSLAGGDGNDTLVGGAGFDYAVFVGAVAVALAGGSASGAAEGVDQLIGIEGILGSDLDDTLTATGVADPVHLLGRGGSDGLTGGDGADTLEGGDGNDTLAGGAGADSMIGGFGDDTYEVDSALDAIDESSVDAAEIDTVRSTIAFTLGANLENLVLLGAAAIDGVGNALANTITGNDAANRLTGGSGADTLVGGGGNDTLDGGSGADSMIGGDGNDTYVVDSIGDRISELGTVTSRSDLVRSAVTWTLGANLERLSLTGTAAINGTGNTLDNVIMGNGAANVLRGGGGNDTLDGGAGNDRLDGGGGSDSMIGGDGNDTYIVNSIGDRISELGTVSSTGDLVRSSVTWTLGANLERLVLTGNSAINGTGNGLANAITGNASANVLAGGGANDTLGGGAGSDTLNGGAGSDRLDGGTGRDSMIGGGGNDTYVVNAPGDLTIETSTLASEIDTVLSSVTRTLGSNLERLTLTGTSAINGKGNTLANLITGNGSDNVLTGAAGNDTLSGGAGNDTLTGGAGNDSLSGGAGLDVFRFNAALSATANVDRIVSFVSADDTIQLEDAVFKGIGPVGALVAGAFRLGTAAGDAIDRIVYDSVTGQLFFDADGTGATAQILFATVAPGTAITSADFFVT